MKEPEPFVIPPVAKDRLVAFQMQIESLNGQMQQFVDGVLIGAGIDVLKNDLSVDLETYTVKITPKE